MKASKQANSSNDNKMVAKNEVHVNGIAHFKIKHNNTQTYYRRHKRHIHTESK